MRLTTFQLAKQRQRFVPAGSRHSCQNCQQGKRIDPQGTTGWVCMRGGFFTTALSVCDMHEQPSREASPPT